jgi:predicted nucleic acid-binding protein
MILADTDILSALAKVARLSLLFTLFRTTRVSIAPGVLAELARSFGLGRQYAQDVFALISTNQIHVVSLTGQEAAFRDTLPITLGRGERESIAIAKARGGTVLSNESRVAHVCRESSIPCFRLPDILRALWMENLAPQEEVRTIIEDLRAKDQMLFKQATLDAIFAE